jgi:hypothetical protein
MRVGIIGCGAVGRKRAAALGDDRLAMVCDAHLDSATRFWTDAGLRHNSHASTCLVSNQIYSMWPHIDAVIIATPNKYLVPYAVQAIKAGKHVLIEKPGATMASDLEMLQRDARGKGVTIHVGYNLRYHPAIMQAKAEIGNEPVRRMRAFYGHGGGATGWRAEDGTSPKLDLGSHLRDLAEMFNPDWHEYDGSWKEWAPRFELTIVTDSKHVHVQGLQPGTTYGPEFCTVTPKALHAPRVTTTYPGPDGSWRREWEAFTQEIAEGSPGNLDAAIAVLRALNY